MTDTTTTAVQWWLTTLGRTLIWARLHIKPGGTAEVLDHHGQLWPYDSADSAQAALLDAEFVAYDGLDEADALAHGFALQEVSPPHDATWTQLEGQMTRSLGGRA